jgi:site-specific DNA-methyltransferase (adenine-specific)
MMINTGLLTSASDNWATPNKLFNDLNKEFNFTLDPCADSTNKKCSKYFTISDNGLEQDWGTNIVFMNPPYGRQIKNWMKKAYESSTKGATVVCLVPSRTDTKWWHDYAINGEIRFIKGRLKFGNAIHNAPFPSAIIIFKNHE